MSFRTDRVSSSACDVRKKSHLIFDLIDYYIFTVLQLESNSTKSSKCLLFIIEKKKIKPSSDLILSVFFFLTNHLPFTSLTYFCNSGTALPGATRGMGVHWLYIVPGLYRFHSLHVKGTRTIINVNFQPNTLRMELCKVNPNNNRRQTVVYSINLYSCGFR